MTDNGMTGWCTLRAVERDDMSNRTWWIVGGVGVSLLAWILLPWWATLLIVLAVVGAPIAGYLMLDDSQRRRLRRIRERRQLGR
jgi:4-hydroxybenzoate polyprenyltransferase